MNLETVTSFKKVDALRNVYFSPDILMFKRRKMCILCVGATKILVIFRNTVSGNVTTLQTIGRSSPYGKFFSQFHEVFLEILSKLDVGIPP